MAAPKLFISYSWSSSEHEQWVIELATNLRESGIDVILDKWDLKEGHDAYAFMEQMVSDPAIGKVAIISDKTYSEKADGRSGGVGTETQIISKEVYENQKQDKFVLVVCEKDTHGKPYLPTYYKSRIYIDLSEPDSYAENFEKLLRWVFDKPLYLKPEIGKPPTFLTDANSISLGTTPSFKRAMDAIKNNKRHASGAMDEYFETFSRNLERFRIERTDNAHDELIVKSIEEFLPYRNEAVQLFMALAQYAPTEENIVKLHRFLEGLIPYMSRPPEVTHYNDWDFDNFKFIVHELFLYAFSILVRYERIEQANYLMHNQYYVVGNSYYGNDVMVRFPVFREYIRSLEARNQRLKLRRLSLRADMLEERSKNSGLEFRYLMQGDFILFMRAEIEDEDGYSTWWPETLLYLFRFPSSFEIFARAVSGKYFEKVKCLLAIDKKEDLVDLLSSYKGGRRRLPRWEGRSINPHDLLGFDQIATKP
ncbi:toll/interleukin-1 receptor domain-containing protein [Thioalkalivibrio denitrificans]|uniref:toll/interleukin-1 receptor domain-containing protein n=1 Tax=Thioalkalivibrio denitrificans TaxID=108003 RepID=UPI000985BACE|nr:TIR domain-containing protein [Thioalkalivibrio denitrificans]